jgi:hypothetical protein
VTLLPLAGALLAVFASGPGTTADPTYTVTLVGQNTDLGHAYVIITTTASGRSTVESFGFYPDSDGVVHVIQGILVGQPGAIHSESNRAMDPSRSSQARVEIAHAVTAAQLAAVRQTISRYETAPVSNYSLLWHNCIDVLMETAIDMGLRVVPRAPTELPIAYIARLRFENENPTAADRLRDLATLTGQRMELDQITAGVVTAIEVWETTRAKTVSAQISAVESQRTATINAMASQNTVKQSDQIRHQQQIEADTAQFSQQLSSGYSFLSAQQPGSSSPAGASSSGHADAGACDDIYVCISTTVPKNRQ